MTGIGHGDDVGQLLTSFPGHEIPQSHNNSRATTALQENRTPHKHVHHATRNWRVD
jgi:hypothetical protein